MFDYAAARRHMIDNQIRTNDVTDPVVLAAFRQVPRETFTPVSRRSVSYSDVHVQTGEGRVMIRPRDFAKMISAADIQPTDVVLIFVNGSVSEAPKTWLDQLANGGRLVCVVQNGPIGRVCVYTRSGDVIGERVDFDASVPALPGFEAAEEFVF